METDDTQNTQTVMLCLLCGELLCTNCYSCQESLNDDESVKIGQLTQHSQLYVLLKLFTFLKSTHF